MKKVVLLGAAALALGLGGCDQLSFFKVASPQRKAGLWEETVQSDRTPTPMVSEWCFDAASRCRCLAAARAVAVQWPPHARRRTPRAATAT
jgi:hypothetical protein